MPGARPTSDNRKSLLNAMVLFIVLFFAAMVFALLMWMKNEDHRQAAADASAKYDELATPGQYSSVKAFVERKGDKVRTTALGRMTDEMKRMATLVAGEELADVPLVGLRQKIDDESAGLLEEVKVVFVDRPEEVDRSVGLLGIMRVLMDDRQRYFDLYLNDEMALEERKSAYEELARSTEARMAVLDGQLAVASGAAATSGAEYNKLRTDNESNYEQLINKMNVKLQEAVDRENKIDTENRDLRAQATDFRAEIKRLKKRLSEFQPDPETEMAAMEPDGKVVQVVPGEELAYINLAKNDHIYRGLTFAVYDRYQAIQRSGQGKAMLEVIEIGDTVSKCRIVKHDPTDPIIKDDLIANLIWSKDKEYLFCVVGDFDFDGNGTREPGERDRIVSMIENWGGRASDELTIDTDFLVLGEPPAVLARPADEYGELAADVLKAYEEAEIRQGKYAEISTDGKALGVPTFNLERFLYFVGYYR